MIVLLLNVRGVGGAPKNISLKILFDIVKPNLVMIQETMVIGLKVREVFSNFFLTWNFCAMDSKGLSGGLLYTWNPKKDNLNVFLTPARILLEGFIKDINLNLKLLNCYGLLLKGKNSLWPRVNHNRQV
jgi:hypothetical protein